MPLRITFLALDRPSLPLILQKTVKIMAKDLVRTRQYVTKFYEMRSQLQAISLRLEVRGLLCSYPPSLAEILFWWKCTRR